MTNLLSFFPKDLSPAQRARLKLLSHFAIIMISTALLAAYSVVSSANGAINWRLLLVVAGGQAFLAGADALKKYYSAQGDLPISAIIDLVQQQAEKNVPKVAYTPSQEGLKQAILQAIGEATPGAPPEQK